MKLRPLLKFALFAISALALTLVTPVFAQTTVPKPPPIKIDFVLTWQAQTTAPQGYTGKILPARGTKIKVFAQPMSDDKPVDLTGYEISWTVNGVPLPQEQNKKSIQFMAGLYGASQYNVAVRARQENTIVGQTTITIPIVAPKVIIDIPYPNQITPREDVLLRALLYFLPEETARRARVSWMINGVNISAEDTFGDLLNTSFDGKASDIPVSVSVRNGDTREIVANALTHISIQ